MVIFIMALLIFYMSIEVTQQRWKIILIKKELQDLNQILSARMGLMKENTLVFHATGEKGQQRKIILKFTDVTIQTDSLSLNY